MATTTLTSNLKLRISSDLTADSKYNLNRLDTLASLYQTDTNDTAKVRSKTNVLIQTNDPDIGGTGSGGTIQFGTTDQPIGTVEINATSVSLSNALSLSDQAVGGTRDLLLSYKSDISGAVDTAANRTLSFDLDGADRELVIPANGTAVLLDAAQTLTNKVIAAGSNTITDLANSNIASSAAIAGSKISPLFGAQEVNSSTGFSSTVGVAFKLPVADGTSTQVLTTDGAGQLFFSSATSNSLANLTDTNLSGPTNGQVLTYNGSEWVNQSTSATGNSLVETWAPADGTAKTITHNFGSRNILIQVLDTSDDYKTIEVDKVCRPTDNTAVLESTIAPPSNWVVILSEVL